MTQVEVGVNRGEALMLLPQLNGVAFGPRLIQELKDAEIADIAVAWIRASGIRHLGEALTNMLAAGGSLRIVVGLDCDNTSIEGLGELLQLAEAAGDRAKVFVRHNEAGAVFHPKLYALRTEHQCRVFVGSNNMTEAGLFLNEEVSGFLCGDRGGELETAIDDLFELLSDADDGIVRPLTPDLLEALAQRGYIRPEATLPGKSSNLRRRARSEEERLFAFRAPRRPRRPMGDAGTRIEPRADEPTGEWRRVFLRLRLSRGTQAQIPAAVVRALRQRLGFAEPDGPLQVTVAGGGGAQMISPAYARGNPTPNTYKFEAFEPEGEPLLRMDIVGNEVTVEKLDSNDPAGQVILAFLQDGLERDPPLTFRKRNDDHATLWRFD